eukprot:6204297-Pleurochrysis_carterae.AAC.1
MSSSKLFTGPRSRRAKSSLCAEQDKANARLWASGTKDIEFCRGERLAFMIRTRMPMAIILITSVSE